jgi:signal transduction histidine kinase
MMLRKFMMFMLAGILAIAAVGCAVMRSTPEQAKAMVEEAVAYLNANGRDKALAELNKSDGMFVKGELYVFVYNLDAVVVAHPYIPSLVGQNLMNKPDSKGKLFRNEIMELAKTKGSGWVDYTYANPITMKEEFKTTYLQRVGDLVLCAGAYK